MKILAVPLRWGGLLAISDEQRRQIARDAEKRKMVMADEEEGLIDRIQREAIHELLSDRQLSTFEELIGRKYGAATPVNPRRQR